MYFKQSGWKFLINVGKNRMFSHLTLNLDICLNHIFTFSPLSCDGGYWILDVWQPLDDFRQTNFWVVHHKKTLVPTDSKWNWVGAFRMNLCSLFLIQTSVSIMNKLIFYTCNILRTGINPDLLSQKEINLIPGSIE